MNSILHQMNSVTAPSKSRVEPRRQIANYFSLLKNMARLGLQLVWERKYGYAHFAEIMQDDMSAAIYADMISSVINPDYADSDYFYPEEIEAIAETLATKNLTFDRAMDFVKKQIASRRERLELDLISSDGDTHAPTIDWMAGMEAGENPIYV